jgi:hypothetical protein
MIALVVKGLSRTALAVRLVPLAADLNAEVITKHGNAVEAVDSELLCERVGLVAHHYAHPEVA